MEAKAVAKNVGIPPRKVRLVANLVRGRGVQEALNLLAFTPTPVARAVAKVVKSAAANAENNLQLTPEGLRVARILVDAGHTLKRFRPQARGRISPLLRRSCHITVVVEGED